MKKFISVIVSIVILIGFTISFSRAYADTDYDGFIKVRLTSPLNSDREIRLYSESGFSLFHINDLESEVEYFDTYEIHAIVEEDEVLLLDSEGELVYLLDNRDNFVLTSGNEKEKKIMVEDIYYRGYIIFNASEDKLDVINYLTLEEYLYGVLPKELGPSFHMEALKAQAIASRTYAIRNLNKHIWEGYNLCDTVHCQVYGGFDVENSITNEAVDETGGMILTYNGYPIDAVFHSNSGGHTDDAKEVWSTDVPYLVGRVDEFSNSFSNASWELDFTSEEISYKLNNSGVYVGKVIDLIILDTSPAGRVNELLIKGTDGEEIISGSKFRSIIGPAILKSTLFTVDKEGIYDNEKKFYSIDENKNIEAIDVGNINVIDGNGNISKVDKIEYIITDRGIESLGIDTIPSKVNFTISGKGYGHGVGMSQYGAHGMALNGYNYEDILKYYYRGVDIEFKE